MNPAIFADRFATAMSELVNGIRQSLVVVRSGRQGAGAGVIWRQDGLIVTNYHVIAAGDLQVELPDGRSCPAGVLGQDPDIDLALLQIDAIGLPAVAAVTDKQPRTGELVLAVGHPWGAPGVATLGILSGFVQLVRHDPFTKKTRLLPALRTDAPLAPGNSGGPLVNAAGQVLGINSMIIGGDQGIAIPAGVVSRFVNETLAPAPVKFPVEAAV